MSYPHTVLKIPAKTARVPYRSGIGILLFLAGMYSVQAQEQSAQREDGWRFQLTPYVWFSALEGDVRPFQGAPSAHVAKSFSELWSNLDAAAFITGTARRDRLVLQADFSHARSSDSATLPIGLPVNAKVRQTSATFTAGYNLIPSDRSSIDVMAGLRSWKIQADVEAPPLLEAGSKSSFIDPVFAARWRQQVAPRWSTLLYADVGGFGVGSESTWQLLGTVNYQARDNLHLSLGYRKLAVDYRDRGRRLDFSMGGPLLGVTWLFGKHR